MAHATFLTPARLSTTQACMQMEGDGVNLVACLEPSETLTFAISECATTEQQ
jgi:hypothetical protein